MKSVSSHRILYLYHFETFLRNAPRVGPLGKALAVPPGVMVASTAIERLRGLYLRGDLSRDILEQFRVWMIEQKKGGTTD